MKKSLLYTITLGALFFLCEASEQTPEEFRYTEITRDYIDGYYPGFIKHSENQFVLIERYKWMNDNWIERFAGFTYGYDTDSKRLLSIGKLVLDEEWRDRLNQVKNRVLLLNDPRSAEYLVYLNGAKNHVFNNLDANYNTKKALNNAMLQLHHFFVAKLQEIHNFDDNYVAHLRNNIEKNEAGLYPMHAHLQQHANENDGEVHPYAIWNMFLAYLFALHKVTSKGS